LIAPSLSVANPSDSEKIKHELGWTPTMQDLSRIIESAWNWMQQHQDRYESGQSKSKKAKVKTDGEHRFFTFAF
jgi:DNA-binding HxlR family transcriptional regulator